MNDQQDLTSPEQAALLAVLLQKRLLAATDWIEACGKDVYTAAWIEYRELLRLVPLQPGWPHEIVWPKPPCAV